MNSQLPTVDPSAASSLIPGNLELDRAHRVAVAGQRVRLDLAERVEVGADLREQELHLRRHVVVDRPEHRRRRRRAACRRRRAERRRAGRPLRRWTSTVPGRAATRQLLLAHAVAVDRARAAGRGRDARRRLVDVGHLARRVADDHALAVRRRAACRRPGCRARRRRRAGRAARAACPELVAEQVRDRERVEEAGHAGRGGDGEAEREARWCGGDLLPVGRLEQALVLVDLRPSSPRLRGYSPIADGLEAPVMAGVERRRVERSGPAPAPARARRCRGTG